MGIPHKSFYKVNHRSIWIVIWFLPSQALFYLGEGIYASLAVVPKFDLRTCIIFMVMLL